MFLLSFVSASTSIFGTLCFSPHGTMLEWRCRAGCGKVIVSNTADSEQCAYDRSYGWDYHPVHNNKLRKGFLFQCCSCAKLHGWLHFDAHGCLHCTRREHGPRHCGDGKDYPHPEPVKVRVLQMKIPKPWMDMPPSSEDLEAQGDNALDENDRE